ncbi:hypothetical protein E1218_09370 [Kribbella turkmenica]|uniref:DUF892 family protein n=1 Tax=Kribbella turkmenica TaxID=2530375 RepID=A0A4V2YGN0_9ACTN|nr:hypothetical protein [Kribbella turkmenica]TDD27727.1 hypothetical protein E1218_09370 [Kribbella turkmenica]
MHLSTYLGLLHSAENSLAEAFGQVGRHHADEPDVEHLCQTLGEKAAGHVESLGPFLARYGEHREDEPDRLRAAEFSGTRSGGVGLLRDLQDLYALASFVDVTWTVVGQAAQGVPDADLLKTVQNCQTDTRTQLSWLQTRIKQAAPQALIVAK